MRHSRWAWVVPATVITIVVFILCMAIDTAINIKDGDLKPLSAQYPGTQEWTVRHEEEPLPPSMYHGHLKVANINDLQTLYLEIFDDKTNMIRIVKLYGVTIPNHIGFIKKDVLNIIQGYSQNRILVVSRTQHPNQQFDDVSIKIEHAQGVLIDLAELLTSKGYARPTGDKNFPMVHALLNQSESYAKDHRLGMWVNYTP